TPARHPQRRAHRDRPQFRTGTRAAPMNAGSDHPAEGRVLLLPATSRDGQAVGAFIEREAIDCLVCRHAWELVSAMKEGAAVLVLTDSALAGPGGPLILD